MTSGALITEAISYTDGVNAADGGNATRRARVLRYLQGVLERVWNYRNWRFIYKTTTMTISSDGTGVLPTDFGRFGWKGGLYLSTGEPMEQAQDVQGLLGDFRRGVRSPTPFCLFGYDTTTGKPKIQTLQTSGTLTVDYCKQTPTLTDGTAAGNELPIPIDYHDNVLLSGVIVKLRASKGDVRDFQTAYLEGLDLMCRNEAPMQETAPMLELARRGW